MTYIYIRIIYNAKKRILPTTRSAILPRPINANVSAGPVTGRVGVGVSVTIRILDVGVATAGVGVLVGATIGVAVGVGVLITCAYVFEIAKVNDNKLINSRDTKTERTERAIYLLEQM